MKWKNLTLQEVCSISKGKKHSEVEQSKTSHRYIQIEDIQDSATLKYTEELGTRCTENDVLIAWDGANAGMVGTGLNGMIGSTLARLKVVSKEVHPYYFYWFLKSKFVEIKSQRTGATIPHVNGGVLRNMKVPIPPLHIQEQIADTLDKADALKRKDQELLTKYDELAQAIFYDMFGDPIRNEKGWIMGKLNEVCKEIVDCPHSTPIQSKEKTEYPCIRTSELNEGFIKWSSMKYVDLSEYNKRTARLKPAAGDIVYGREGSFGEAIIIPIDTKMCLGQRTMLMRPNEKVTSVFLWWQLRSDYVYNQAKKKNCGATVGHVNVKDIKEFNIFIPPLELQSKFEKKLENIIKTREVLNQNIAISTKLFNNYLQNWFQ